MLCISQDYDTMNKKRYLVVTIKKICSLTTTPPPAQRIALLRTPENEWKVDFFSTAMRTAY